MCSRDYRRRESKKPKKGGSKIETTTSLTSQPVEVIKKSKKESNPSEE